MYLPIVFAQMQPAGQLRDIKQPIEVSVVNWWLWGLIGAGAIIAAVLGTLAYQKYIVAHKNPEKEPWEKALDKLEALKVQGLLDKGKMEEFYVQLSAIIRGYFEQRFRVHAPEMTSEEFLRHVEEKSLLREDLQKTLRDFLTSCDMVKFARYQSEKSEAENAMGLVSQMIEGTK